MRTHKTRIKQDKTTTLWHIECRYVWWYALRYKLHTHWMVCGVPCYSKQEAKQARERVQAVLDT